MIKRRRLGRTPLEVSELGLGCMGFGPRDRWFGGADPAEAARMVALAFDSGVNLFDTADCYGDGESERLLGRALGARRAEAVVATKVMWPTPSLPEPGLSRTRILKACEESLRRLNTDWIDLYQVHSWDDRTPIEETMRALAELVASGKVRHLGCSNLSPSQLGAAQSAARSSGGPRFESCQLIYNPLERYVEREILPACLEADIGLLSYSPLAGGYLTGKYLRGDGGRHSDPRSAFPMMPDRVAAKAGRAAAVVERLSRAYGRPGSHVPLAWALSKPWMTSVLAGATSLAQLRENLSVSGWVLEERGARALELACL